MINSGAVHTGHQVLGALGSHIWWLGNTLRFADHQRLGHAVE